MDGEQIFGVIMMCFVGFGCGTLFYGIGVWAQKSKGPIHFYTGTTVDPKTISNIPAYNRENARMWKLYSIPYWLTGVAGILSIFYDGLTLLSGILLMLAGTVGIIWLVLEYKRISKKYTIR